METYMKPKLSLTAALSVLLLALAACSSFRPATPLASPPGEPSTPPGSTPSITLQPSPETQTPTPEALATATEEPTIWPTIEPQPAAQAHIPSGNHIQLDEIRMLSQTEGWGTSGPYILITADGGKTWREVGPGVPQVDKVYAAFLDMQTAWVVFSNAGNIGDKLLVYFTTDGGRTWTFNQGPPVYLNVNGDTTWAQFAVLDARNLWVLVRGVFVGAGTHFTHELFHSPDGGLTWTSLDGEISDDYTGMVFADASHGLRTLQTIGFYESGPPAFDVTADGGAVWEGRQLPPPPEAPDLFNQYPYCETYQPVLHSAQSIQMLMGCFDYYSPPKKFTSYLYSSPDGGTTWTTVHLPAKVQASLDTLIYFDLNHALLLGRDIYQSADGGQTWSFVQTVNWDAQFTFVDPLHGWAVGGAPGEVALVNTINGGRNWALIDPRIAP